MGSKLTLKNMIMTTTIYQSAKKLLPESEIDHHESDLYLKVSDVSNILVSEYAFKQNVKKFTSNIDGKLWFDIPFAYDPFWDKRK